MSNEDRTTDPETNQLWIRFSTFVLGGDDGFTAMNKAIEAEGWVKADTLATAWASGYWHGTSHTGPLNDAAVDALNPYTDAA